MPNASVFVSYAHESDTFRQQVRQLCNWLRSQGVAVVCDFDHEVRPPDTGWPTWMQHGIEDALVVLVVASPKYKARFEKRSPTDSGLGVRWEGAIITQDLYVGAQLNNKFYPVIPDGGSHDDVPKALRPWNNGHRFPSGQDAILALIRACEPSTSAPAPAIPTTAPNWAALNKPAQRGLLQGPQDNRLQPREGQLFGRQTEVAAVLKFLTSDEDGAVVCAQITGTGGIGKTEVCKAALKDWLTQRSSEVAFYVDVPDSATADELIALLGQALGADNLGSLAELAARLQPGLYYLDNLEGVAERPEGQQLLRELRQLPGVRVLASSRISLPGILGKPIEVGVLPLADALAMFRELWLGADALPPAAPGSPVETLVDKELGCHALSISLLARLGGVYSFTQLQQRWQASGTAIAHDTGDASRQGSLARSLRLTSDALQPHAGALDLWTLAALFPQGVDENLFALLEQWGSWAEQPARQQLVRHHVLTLREGRLHLLPPLARYAIQQALATVDGFSWVNARPLGFRLFQQLADAAKSVASSQEALTAREVLQQQFNALARVFETDVASPQPDSAALHHLNQALLNEYQFRAALGRQLLQALAPHLPESASAILYLGDLERRLGQIDKARPLFEQALALYKSQQDGVGQANTLQALADLESRLGKVDKTRALYEQALALYKSMRDGLGQANTLKALGDLESRLGQIDKARALYEQALALHKSEQAGLGQANTLKALGQLESRLGQTDKARALYEKALELYKSEQTGLGQANTLQALGDLESKLGEADKARALYEHALALYKSEQAGLGQANTLKALGDLESRLGQVDRALTCYETAAALYANEQETMGLAYTHAKLALFHHAKQQIETRDECMRLAMDWGVKSNTESVMRYVSQVLVKIHGSPEATQAWIERLQAG